MSDLDTKIQEFIAATESLHQSVTLRKADLDNAADAATASKNAAKEAEIGATIYPPIASTQADIAASESIKTAADRIVTNEDRIATGLDRNQTGLDRTQTGLDRVSTGESVTTSSGSANSASADLVQTGLDRVATGQDKVITGQDRVATGQDRTQTKLDAESTGISRAAASKNAIIAETQAQLAAESAAGVSSVLQQDLSGVNAAALHRSPNAVTAMFVYDTSKDSDGGAWTERCQHTSWYNEPLCGKWLGAQVSEAAARGVSGATTSDYFQLTTNGRFYKLNTTSGVTEVFRGNKRDFPRLAAIVAEEANVTIYDLTEAGRPMWMRFVNIGGVTKALEGVCFVAGPALLNLNFARDSISRRNTSGFALQRFISTRLTENFLSLPGSAIQPVTTFDIALLDGSPIDEETRLKLPSVILGFSGADKRLALIKHQQEPVFSSNVTLDNPSTYGLRMTKYMIFGGTENYLGRCYFFAFNPVKLESGFVPTVFNNNVRSLRFNSAEPFGIFGLLIRKRNTYGTPIGIEQWVINKSALHRNLTSTVAPAYNTGYMVGDIRRAYLADITAESVSGTELVTNGTFDTGTTGWTAGGSAILSVDSGRLKVENGAATSGYAYQVFNVIIGKTYRFVGSKTAGTATSPTVFLGLSANDGWYTGNPTPEFVFTATHSTLAITVKTNSSNAGEYALFDSFSVREVLVRDHSYKGKIADLTGTLTKSQVASNAQLVAYSGFSNQNYLREPYSADLDFGTGEWNVGAWVNVPTGNAAAGTAASCAYSTGPYITLGIDATNKLTATAYDGATTRTVTTTAAYNTATWLHANAVYKTDGSLAIFINGQEVAVTRGNPLLTLNNPDAVLTIGNSYNLDAPFPGSIALLKLSATAPTYDQAAWMYEQEKELFRDGAQCCLPDSNTIQDLTYDDKTDSWVTVSTTNESTWTGLVRTSVTPVSAGSYSKVSTTSGVKLQARITTNPGVDVTLPSYNLKEEVLETPELSSQRLTLDYVGGFTATTVTGNTAITAVSGLSYPSQTTIIGAQVSGSGIPANTSVVGISGTTIYLSAPTTASASNVQLSFTDFVLPLGYEAKRVLLSGVAQREGPTASFTRLFDGFRETIRFAVSPSYTASVQIQAMWSDK